MVLEIVCIFKICDWVHLFNVKDEDNNKVGIYQCKRCKTVSRGCCKEKH